jgi:hypothetical protein
VSFWWSWNAIQRRKVAGVLSARLRLKEQRCGHSGNQTDAGGTYSRFGQQFDPDHSHFLVEVDVPSHGALALLYLRSLIPLLSSISFLSADNIGVRQAFQ